MEIGVIFPQTDIGPEPETLVRYAQTAEELGFGHLVVFEHALGVNRNRAEGWEGPYDHTDQFHDPFTLLSYLSAVTDVIDFVTGVVVLPQRKTPLVAKQAAQVDRFSDGRFRLGVGVGWNPIEFVGMGEDFGQRGGRIEEQVEVLRQLWTENSTTFEGEFHDIPDAGINPLPVQQHPDLDGWAADPVLRRVARMADGWIALRSLEEGTPEQLGKLNEYAEAVGRDPGDIGVHGLIPWLNTFERDVLIDRVERREELGADYLSISWMRQGYGPDEHRRFIERLADTLADAGIDLTW